MSKPDAPPQPNFTGAAAHSQYTPYGSLTWAKPYEDPSTWSSYLTLAPQAQKTLDAQMGLSKGLADTATGQLGDIQDFYSGPMDVQSLSQPAYDAITSRLDPRFERQEDQLRTRLANQGLVAGGEAFDNEMRGFNESRNDAYNQAQLSALNNASQFYNQPLNTFNALRTGAQVQNPQFGQSPLPGALQAQGQYGMQQYGNDVNQYNAMMGGLFGLGSSGIGAYGLMNAAPFAVSDRRLKSNIVRVGTHPLGVGIYEYDLFGERQRGVMADEVETVKPEAVIEINGVKAVNYGLL